MRIQTTQQINYQSQNFSDQSLYTMVTSDDLVQEFPLDSDSNMINLIENIAKTAVQLYRTLNVYYNLVISNKA